jgi:hypothetical protein
MGIMKIASRLWGSRSSTAMALTVAAIAVAVILLASNFTIINAQQQQQQSLTSRSGEIENGTTTTTATTTTFQSTNDSFSVQVPQGWVIQDLNNTGSALLEESTRGYGLLAQLCPEEQQQQQVAPPTNASGGTTTNSSSDGGGTSNCQGTQEVIYIIRYPDLDTRIPSASNVTTATPTTTTSSSNNNNMTTDNVLSYHLQKLQEVGYRSIQIVNSTEVRLNLTNPQTNETIATVPSRLVEIAYSTNSAPNETRTGYFISTATNGTPPNLGTTKGYAVFYEGNSTNNTTAAEITTATAASGSLAPTPLPPVVGQVFDSFELIASPEVAQTMAQEEPQAAEFAEGAVDDGADDNGGGDDDGADDNGGGDDDGADDNGGGDDDGADDNGGGDDDGADDNGGGDDDGPDRCISVGGRSTSVTGC